MKKIYIYAALMTMLGLQACEVLEPFEDKPVAVECNAEFVFQLKDASGYMEKAYGTDAVNNAVIKLKSVTYGNEYELKTDSTGKAVIKGIYSDTYQLTVERELTEDEVEKSTGFRSLHYKLINKVIRQICLNPSAETNVEIPLQVSAGGAFLMINEIYACGPVGSGLYFHDKYFEICNPTDSVQYLDGIIVAFAYSSKSLGINYVNDPTYVHSNTVWKFPGTGKDYPVQPGQIILVSEDGMNHKINAPQSVDLSSSNFEFFKSDAPDVDNSSVINMVKIYQKSGNDWIPGAESESFIIARCNDTDIKTSGDELLIPYECVIDGVEYMSDPSKLKEKELNYKIDAGAAGGIQFYTGKSMERIATLVNGKLIFKDNDNSSLDFRINDHPTPGYHYNTGL